MSLSFSAHPLPLLPSLLDILSSLQQKKQGPLMSSEADLPRSKKNFPPFLLSPVLSAFCFEVTSNRGASQRHDTLYNHLQRGLLADGCV